MVIRIISTYLRYRRSRFYGFRRNSILTFLAPKLSNLWLLPLINHQNLERAYLSVESKWIGPLVVAEENYEDHVARGLNYDGGWCRLRVLLSCAAGFQL